ncbi:hypothetical protein FisN_1Lh100 [Fistulifera solaris]|uniref:Nucleoside-diphosphate kinase n=1 Tax=Fistulifera solaris TaxID=1519565 RepID=A0A1Z5K526_FISSO|nr:hypothetical protein FisN_1Lh100 [Fistulifera solaris]|eukprot:GAX21272.1 hypothetical protein FisN_1Lh100 [Fistulifera solaris]
MDFLLFTATAGLSIWKAKSDKTCHAPLTNSAFVFVKPHANTASVQDLVRKTLKSKGVTILSEVSISGETIDEKKLIDQHYYAIASKATILPAKDIPVPADKFQNAFGESWETVLAENRACNAMEACKRFGCDAQQLDEAWGKAEKVEKFGGGFYCGIVSMNGQKLYVFNAFFMSMRSKFVGAGTSIYCFVVEFSPKTLSWSNFRNSVLGPTDPADGPPGSLRKAILDDYTALGLAEKPNKGDNGVHASASPFEGLAERMNWLGTKISDDPFGSALLAAGLTEKTIKDWSVDPRVKQPDGSMGSVFDALEDMDVDECLEKLVLLNKLNA